MKSLQVLLSFLLLVIGSQAQFQFFDQMFGQQQRAQPQEPQNVASDSKWYRDTYMNAHCSNYLCPGTLSCVAVPHHCPCPFSDIEDKVELGEGSAICVSKGGFKIGEAKRKIELARKGLL